MTSAVVMPRDETLTGKTKGYAAVSALRDMMRQNKHNVQELADALHLDVDVVSKLIVGEYSVDDLPTATWEHAGAYLHMPIGIIHICAEV